MNPSKVATIKFNRFRMIVSGIVVASGLIVGIGAPALAYTRTDSKQDFTEGNKSANWSDSSPSYAQSRVTVDEGCNRDFTVTIRENRTLEPDADRGHEKVNCTSYDDAVYADSSTNFSKTFHYDGTGIGYKSAKPYVPYHAKFTAVVRW